ncbi:hypothetical protein NNJEOMEG_01725 [Fundidesulfovibrio magnetotacticus]|uniref:diguanylate cyclase n=2 Tax=Fundidesulfovibrio magnetotacticus TaxID=2730080 RepID=A0A6V8LW49_9BACT|nr:hypothetical protein NNJEOMEG_01725 [Fundidesulfovibrio magnetotacticus]
MRRAVENTQIAYNGVLLGKLTISIGVAEYPRDSLNLDELIQCADKALYMAKKDRNKVASYWDPQRRYPRVPSDFLTSIWDDDNGAPALGKAKNISTGGMLCETSHRLSTSSRIKLSIDNPRFNLKFTVGAKVERVHEIGNGLFHVGLSFILSQEDVESQLIDLVAGLSSTSH